MKLKIVLSALALVALTLIGVNFLQNAHAGDGKILYYTCPMHPSVKSDKPGACPNCNMDLQPVYAEDAAKSADRTNNAPANAAKPMPYPLKTCVVSGEKLGEMGVPIVFVYTNANQEIKFCCPGCKPKFLKDPDRYMKIIKDAQNKK